MIDLLHATHVYECKRRTAKLVIPRERTPLRSCSTLSKSSSLHTSRESPVLPEGQRHKAFTLRKNLFRQHLCFM